MFVCVLCVYLLFICSALPNDPYPKVGVHLNTKSMNLIELRKKISMPLIFFRVCLQSVARHGA